MKMPTYEEKVIELKKRREELFALKEPIDKELVWNYDEIKKFQDSIDKEVIESQKASWDWILEENGESGRVKHDYAEKRLNLLGLGSSGYYPEIKQKAVRMALYRVAPEKCFTIEDIEKSLNTILPFIKPLKIDGIGKAKKISICENTYEEHGSYSLCVRGNEYFVMLERWGSAEILKSCKNLMEILKYILE